ALGERPTVLRLVVLPRDDRAAEAEAAETRRHRARRRGAAARGARGRRVAGLRPEPVRRARERAPALRPAADVGAEARPGPVRQAVRPRRAEALARLRGVPRALTLVVAGALALRGQAAERVAAARGAHVGQRAVPGGRAVARLHVELGGGVAAERRV